MKRLVSLGLVFLLTLAVPMAAMAQEPAAITKGEFVKLMLEKAGVDLGDKSYSDFAVEYGILKGKTDSSLGLEDPLTYRTAGILMARFLGLSSLNLHELASSDEFAYALEYRLLPVDVAMDSAVTASAANDMLDSLFASSAKAREFIAEKNNQVAKKYKSSSTMTIKIQNKEDMSGMPGDMVTTTTTRSEFDMDKGLYQETVTSGAGIPETRMEMYVVGDTVYMKSKDTQGKEMWYAVKGIAPDFSKLADITPEQSKDLDKYGVYRDMGYTIKDGKQVRVIDAFLNIRDMKVISEALNLAGMGGIMQNITAQGQAIEDMYRGIYGRIVYYIDPETKLIQSAEIYERVDLNPDFTIQGQSLNISSEVISGTIDYSDYGGDDIVIELPEEAKNAPVIDITREFQKQ